MAAAASDFATGLEGCLHEGIKDVASEIGAHTAAVILLEGGRAIRVVHRWPCAGMAEISILEDECDALGSVAGPANVDASSSIAGLLNRIVGPPANSFLLIPRWGERFKVVIAFGFASGERLPVSAGSHAALHLAAFAAQALFEIRRLRRDLGIVSERLGRRKVVERAKGLLQNRHGWTEQQAYEHLRKLSRQRRKTMADVAQDVLRM